MDALGTAGHARQARTNSSRHTPPTEARVMKQAPIQALILTTSVCRVALADTTRPQPQLLQMHAPSVPFRLNPTRSDLPAFVAQVSTCKPMDQALSPACHARLELTALALASPRRLSAFLVLFTQTRQLVALEGLRVTAYRVIRGSAMLHVFPAQQITALCWAGHPAVDCQRSVRHAQKMLPHL